MTDKPSTCNCALCCLRTEERARDTDSHETKLNQIKNRPYENLATCERSDSEGLRATSQRIYDNPNHPHYGPVRRMHIILMQLGIEDEIQSTFLTHWDSVVAELLGDGLTEQEVARALMRRWVHDSK